MAEVDPVNVKLNLDLSGARAQFDAFKQQMAQGVTAPVGGSSSGPVTFGNVTTGLGGQSLAGPLNLGGGGLSPMMSGINQLTAVMAALPGQIANAIAAGLGGGGGGSSGGGGRGGSMFGSIGGFGRLLTGLAITRDVVTELGASRNLGVNTILSDNAFQIRAMRARYEAGEGRSFPVRLLGAFSNTMGDLLGFDTYAKQENAAKLEEYAYRHRTEAASMARALDATVSGRDAYLSGGSFAATVQGIHSGALGRSADLERQMAEIGHARFEKFGAGRPKDGTPERKAYEAMTAAMDALEKAQADVGPDRDFRIAQAVTERDRSLISRRGGVWASIYRAGGQGFQARLSEIETQYSAATWNQYDPAELAIAERQRSAARNEAYTDRAREQFGFAGDIFGMQAGLRRQPLQAALSPIHAQIASAMATMAPGSREQQQAILSAVLQAATIQQHFSDIRQDITATQGTQASQLAATLARNPLGAEVAGIQGAAELRARHLERNGMADLAAEERRNAAMQVMVAGQRRRDQETLLNLGGSTQERVLRRQLAMDTVGASAAGIGGGAMSEAAQLMQAGFGPQALQAIKNGQLQLDLLKQNYGLSFRASQINLRLMDVSNARDSQDPMEAFKRIQEEKARLGIGFSSNAAAIAASGSGGEGGAKEATLKELKDLVATIIAAFQASIKN